MAKTDKHSVLKTGMAKIADVASAAKARISRKVAVGVGAGVVLLAAVVALVVFRPDLRVVDAVNQKVGIAPTYEQLKLAVAKDPKNADLQLDLAHAAFDSGKKEQALAA